MKKIISFPHVGDYYYPFSKLLTLLTEQEVIIPPPITKKTLELGTKYAPDTVCIPFKYNLGNFIESLNEGANILFTAGGGCRYRYYAEVTETILKDLGYQFTFYKLIKKENKFYFCKERGMFKKIAKYFLLITLLGVIITAIFNIKENTTISEASSGGGNTSDVQLLARAINGEARGEPYEGQVAVGAVILNRVRDSRFPNTIAGVIYQPGAFTAVADGQINVPIDESSTVVKAARDALNGWDPTEGAVYYFNPDTATSDWIWSRPLIKTIGKHRFCK